VSNKCTSHNSVVLAICVPKISKFGEDLTAFWQKQVGSFLAHPVHSVSSWSKASFDIAHCLWC